MTWLAFIVCLLPSAYGADLKPAKGRLLVATELVGGEIFARTVILLLRYDEHGAMGIVINRPTDIVPSELVGDADALAAYSGALYFGGPVQMHSLRALQHADTPPENAEAVIESVYLVRVDDALEDTPADRGGNLRLYIGYAGWGAGQLDREMGRGSWHVVPASHEHVFAEDPRALWKRLTPPSEHRAALHTRMRN